MLSQTAIEKILALSEKVVLTPDAMADKLNITFYPYNESTVSPNVISFTRHLERVMQEVKVNIIPYEKSLERIPMSKVMKRTFKICINNVIVAFETVFRLRHKNPYVPFSILRTVWRRNKIKKGISVIALGENETSNLPMDNTSSFTESSVITILDWPKNISEDSSFMEHFDTAMNLFAYNMTNIVIGVKENAWILYNFNASHPIYSMEETEFKHAVLHALIPKIVAPIRPVKFKEFTILREQFNPLDDLHKPFTEDLVASGTLLESTNLYPKGKQIDTLPFRNNLYKWIGKIHLDNRNGMSYGFLAHQMPIQISELIPFDDASKILSAEIPADTDYFYVSEMLYVIVSVSEKGRYVMHVPDIWVLTQRSGCDKTHIVPEKDLVKMGLSNGKMLIQTPKGLVLSNDYRTSFDTRVILAHAVGNAIIASIFAFLDKTNAFATRAVGEGFSISHWHGYIDPAFIPQGWFAHGIRNPHVACSSPQSAIYAIQGKLEVFQDALLRHETYSGDVHIEPHHGTNIVYSSLSELAEFFRAHPEASVLGNKHYYKYK